MHVEVWEDVCCTVRQPSRRTSAPFLPNTGHKEMETADKAERSLNLLAALADGKLPGAVRRQRMTRKRSFWTAGLMKARRPWMFAVQHPMVCLTTVSHRQPEAALQPAANIARTLKFYLLASSLL